MKPGLCEEDAELNYDVLAEIFSRLRPFADPDRPIRDDNVEDHLRLQTLTNISLCSRALHEIAEPALHHSLDFRRRPFLKLRSFLQRLLEQPRLGRHVQKMLVCRSYFSRAYKTNRVAGTVLHQYFDAAAKMGLEPSVLEELYVNLRDGVPVAELSLVPVACPNLSHFGFGRFVRSQDYCEWINPETTALLARFSSVRRISIKDEYAEIKRWSRGVDRNHLSRGNRVEDLRQLLQLPMLELLEVDRALGAMLPSSSTTIYQNPRIISFDQETFGLRQLRLTTCALESDDLKAFLAACPYLRSLELEWTNLSGHRGLESFASLLSNHKKLERLKLSAGPNLSHRRYGYRGYMHRTVQDFPAFGSLKDLPSLRCLDITYSFLLEYGPDRQGRYVVDSDKNRDCLIKSLPATLRTLQLRGNSPDLEQLLSDSLDRLLRDDSFSVLSTVYLSPRNYDALAKAPATDLPHDWSQHMLAKTFDNKQADGIIELTRGVHPVSDYSMGCSKNDCACIP